MLYVWGKPAENNTVDVVRCFQALQESRVINGVKRSWQVEKRQNSQITTIQRFVYVTNSLAKVVSNFVHRKNVNASSFITLLFQKRKMQTVARSELHELDEHFRE